LSWGRRRAIDAKPVESGERREPAIHAIDDALALGPAAEHLEHALELLAGLVALADADRRPRTVHEPGQSESSETTRRETPLRLQEVEAVVPRLLGGDAPQQFGQHRMTTLVRQQPVAVHREQLVGRAPRHVCGGDDRADRTADMRKHSLVPGHDGCRRRRRRRNDRAGGEGVGIEEPSDRL
jgi:hypothetical protein